MLRACYYLLNPPSQLPSSSSCQYKMQLKTLDSMTCLLALLTRFLSIWVHFLQILIFNPRSGGKIPTFGGRGGGLIELKVFECQTSFCLRNKIMCQGVPPPSQGFLGLRVFEKLEVFELFEYLTFSCERIKLCPSGTWGNFIIVYAYHL